VVSVWGWQRWEESRSTIEQLQADKGRLEAEATRLQEEKQVSCRSVPYPAPLDSHDAAAH
jgi:hypothetical protein